MSQHTNHTVQSIFYPMKNVIQHYAWGSVSSFNQLFGIANKTGEPQAEIWMGAHPNGCSTVMVHGQEMKLSSLIAQNKTAFLGESVSDRFGALPYLFKVLAAGKALSVQVHPNKLQAEKGYAREEQQGIPMTSRHRNYKDPNHKPELVYALTEYKAMNGFRPLDEIIMHFSALAIPQTTSLLDELMNNPTADGLANFFYGLLSMEGETKTNALTTLLSHAASSAESVFELIMTLESQYPGDIGLFTPLILNVITLQPGEAMYLDAQTPHAYLQGTGLEIMANSDNVLRAGLTPKYIDVKELISCTIFKEKPYEKLTLNPINNHGISDYPIPVEDFKFAMIDDSHQHDIQTNSAEILLPLDGTLELTHPNGESCTVSKGTSVFIPAYAQHYSLQCTGRVARAYC